MHFGPGLFFILNIFILNTYFSGTEKTVELPLPFNPSKNCEGSTPVLELAVQESGPAGFHSPGSQPERLWQLWLWAEPDKPTEAYVKD